MANIVACANLPQLLLLITILTYLEREVAHAATEEGFSEKIHKESSKDLVPEWKWSVNKPDGLDFQKHFDIIRRTLGVISAIFTIWIFMETRDRQYEKQNTDELLGEFNLQLENLNYRVEEVKKSLLHLSCLYDAVQAQSESKVQDFKMTNIIFRCVIRVIVFVLMVFCVQHSNTHGFTNEEKVHHLYTEDELEPVTKENVSVRRKLRFLGDTPSAIFINVLSVVSSIFTIWSFIETRDVIKAAKTMEDLEETSESEKTELLEELIQKLDVLHSGVAQEMASVRHSLKQLICRFDAVHAKSKGINQDCWQFIRPHNQASAKLSAKHSQKIRHEDDNSLVPKTMSDRDIRFLGEKPGQVMMRLLSIVSALFTIWIFAETRDKKNEKHVDEFLEDLSLQVENLNFRMEDVKNSLLQLTCLFNVVQARNKGTSRECLQFPQERKQVTAPILAKPTYFTTNSHIKKKSSLSISPQRPAETY
ncbi:hypothetical protein GHT06_007887 [Daphnia sinensis]|uniref:Uncharacterized protein n=1 Tax=Daphnia sinensis TaxID=1820382 RepID=A0AAD5Q1I4_9CRUS|nr:hypothetical protein GHT06_007887 [Daphnia sinensis]